ncbi:MAG: MBL fold metallo-hydrolase [Acidobacteriaceae bacterium]
MFLKQYYLGCLAHASYLVADQATRTAIVVDPQRDIQQYLDDAARMDFAIRHVFLTHFHADFVAGHLELRDRCGAAIHLGARAEAEYPFVAMKDGDSLTFPGVRFEILETPGHTIESICLLLFDRTRDAESPHAVLTGDTLFIGDVGRPDLRASLGWTAADLGAHLHTSLHTKLLPLPDATLVYPAHGAGSLCGKNLSTETVSTIGEQRRYNYALRPMSKEQFIEMVTADQPDAPPYFTYDAILNTRERATLDSSLDHALHPISLDELLRLENEGAQVLDVRPPDLYARGHLRGTINIGLDGQFASWAGTILDQEKPIVLIAEPGYGPGAGRAMEAAIRLGRIGFDEVRGYLDGGMQSLAGRDDLLARTERRSASEIYAELAGCAGEDGTEPTHGTSQARSRVIDVRTAREYEGKHIAGATNIPLSRLLQQLHSIPRERPVILHCAGGYRSSIAASLLARHGVTQVTEMAGGLAAWEAEELPVATAIQQH